MGEVMGLKMISGQCPCQGAADPICASTRGPGAVQEAGQEEELMLLLQLHLSLIPRNQVS